MCEYTGNCKDLSKTRQRIDMAIIHLEAEHPKLYLKLKPILDDIMIFMTDAIIHLEKLYKKNQKDDNLEKYKPKDITYPANKTKKT